jgi:mannose/fructose/N-acetylgalactosamine-specific phosphotransferase system component IID
MLPIKGRNQKKDKTMNIYNKMKQNAVVLGTIVSGVATSAIVKFASAAADPDIATMVTTTGTSLKENLLSGLTTAVPLIVGVTSIFWAYKFISRKIRGSAH